MLPDDLVRLEDQPTQTRIALCDGLWAKGTKFPAGSYIPQHSHETAHLSLVGAGQVRVWKDGVLLGDYAAPAGVVIEALAKHTFLALTDATVFCVHRVDEDGEPMIHALHEIV